MNDKALQDQLDKPDGAAFHGDRYVTRVKPYEPTSKRKSHGRCGRNYPTKLPRSNA